MADDAGQAYVVDKNVLDLREQLFCDWSLDQALAHYPIEEPVLRAAIAAISKRQYSRARRELEGRSSVDRLRLTLSYWLVLIKAIWMDGDFPGVQRAALRMLGTPNLKAREQIQAWAIWRELGFLPDRRDAEKVLGVVVEMGLEKAAAVVAGYADGEARMFWTTGGLIAGLEDDSVLAAAKALVDTAQPALELLPIDTRRPLPAPGWVRFAILTPAGMHTADLEKQAVEKPSHRLFPVYVAMHRLLNSLIRAHEARRREDRSPENVR